jgi:hypothetical protein
MMNGFRAMRGRRGLPALLACMIALGMATPAVAVAEVAATGYTPPAPSPGPTVKGVTDARPHFVKVPDKAAHGYAATETAWPAAGSGLASLALPTAGVKAGAVSHAAGMPVWAQAVAGKGGYTGPRSIGVRVLGHAAAQAAGVTGALFTVTPAVAAPVVGRPTAADANAVVIHAVAAGVTPTGGAGAGTVRVGLDYRSFAQASGGNFGSRPMPPPRRRA